MYEETNNNTSITEIKKSFAKGLNFYKLFWIFYIGCFSGVVVETVWCILTNGYFESRTALILSPLNPVYGFGAVLISVIFIRMIDKKNIYIFLGCMFVGGLFEYLCSLFQEIFFGSVSWSYQADSLGIFQRTSLVYCIFWGFLGIVWVRVIYPLLSKSIETIPNRIGKPLTYVLLVAVILDCIFSSAAVLRQEERKHGIAARNAIERYYDSNYGDDVLKKIYPHMTFVK
jgi:uncharacterized membrane protein